MRKPGLSSEVLPSTCVRPCLDSIPSKHLHTTHIVLLPGAVAHVSNLSRLGQQEAVMTLKASGAREAGVDTG